MDSACRTCLSVEYESMTNIFEKVTGSDNSSLISQMIMDIASVQVQQDDGYSQYMCEFCLQSLNNAYDFRIQCQRSDQIMRVGNVNNSINHMIPLEFVKEECHEDTENKHHLSYENDQDKLDAADVTDILQNIKVELTEPDNANELVFTKLIVTKKTTAKRKKKSPKIKKKIPKQSREIKLKVPAKKEDAEQTDITDEFVGTNNKNEKEKKKLEHHLFVVNELGNKEYTCYVCKTVLDNQNDFLIHTRNHNPRAPYICRQCGKCYTRSGGLQSHYVHHTVGKRYCCEVCGNRYFRSGDLAFHMRSHTGIKPYSCPVCQKTFRRNYELRNHSQSHSTTKLYTCTICGKNLSNLIYHMRMHRKERPYKCNDCQKTFVSKCDLNAHMAVHTGNKKYKCNVCEKSFGWSSGLRLHSLIHQNKRSHICEICGKAFMYKHVMKSHLSKHLNV